jgi:hypothetical protein
MSVIIKECVDCPVERLKNQTFVGEAVVEHELSLIPSLSRDDIECVEVFADPDNFKVELVCCNLIVVCGFATKIIKPKCGKTIKQDFAFQAKISAEINDPMALKADKWKVTGVEVCDGCYTLLCPAAPAPCEPTRFFKLREKDIFLFEVSSVCPHSPYPYVDEE